MSHALVSMAQQGLSQGVCNVVLKGTEDNTKWPRNWHSLRTTAGRSVACHWQHSLSVHRGLHFGLRFTCADSHITYINQALKGSLDSLKG